jgi:prevent-host-death family protein
MTVAVRELKNRLSEYLRRVRDGERIIVTDRGRPIAELTPLGRRRLSPAHRLALLVEAGEVTPGKGARLTEFKPVELRGKSLSETVLEDRG